MSKTSKRPPLGGIGIGESAAEMDRIREYGLSKGFLPTETGEGATARPAAAPPPASPKPAAPAQIPAAPTPAAPAPAAVPPAPLPPAAIAQAVAQMLPPGIRPAPTRPWQAMLPDYLSEELRHAAAREGTAQKVIVMRALRLAGFRVDDIDLQDLRRR